MIVNPRFDLGSFIKSSRTALMMASYVLALGSPVYAQEGLFTKPIETLTQYRDRPLFSPSRRSVPVAAPVEDNAAPIAAQPLNAVLLGLVSSSDGNGVVVLRVEGRADAQRIRIGESVNGWQLDRIESRNAIFSSDGQTVTLTFPLNTDANGVAVDGGVADAPINPVVLPTPDPTAP